MMKKSKYVICILIFLKANLLFGQMNNIKSISVKYVDFSILTDTHVKCQDFEASFDYKIIEIKDSLIIKSLMDFTTNLKKDTISNYLPDSRAKIIIYYRFKREGVICVSNFGICYDNTPIIFNEIFVNYIKKLIKLEDKNFEFKL